MAEIRHIRVSDPRETKEDQLLRELTPNAQASVRYCAYNLTRGRFLSTGIEAADFTPATLETRLPGLGPGSLTALWIFPFRGLSPTNFRFPVDLVILDKRCAVLEAVQSFPVSLSSSANIPVASALILPIHTIASVGVTVGDQLILCTPDEMIGNLRSLMGEEPGSLASIDASGGSKSDSDMRTFRLRSLGNAMYWSDPAKSGTASDASEVDLANAPEKADAPEKEDPERKAMAEQFGWNHSKARRNWFQRWWSKESKDPRGGLRETMPGLVAHFFASGKPSAHGIRNISATGLYVLTEERWYLGTVVRMTLSDQMQKTFNRAITLNAKVVRWSNDGVGLQFILRQKGDHVPEEQDLSGGTTTEMLEEFLRKYRDDHLASQD